MIRFLAPFVIGSLLALLVIHFCSAHDDAEWIRRNSITNKLGEYCCGPNDCKMVEAVYESRPVPGYRVIDTGEFVPEYEATPTPVDGGGKFWLCRWGGQRKCFFAPMPTG